MRLGRSTRKSVRGAGTIRLGKHGTRVAFRAPREPIGEIPAPVVAISTTRLHPLLSAFEETEIKVSIVFGTYNRKALLERCIRSIRVAAKNIVYEIIVTDGGSTDGSVQWLEQQEDVTLIRGDLSGAVPAFNAAARKARGEFIVALNDDAELDPNALSRALQQFSDPLVGQVAMSFYEGGKWKIEEALGKIYANFAVTRHNIVDAVEKITGGMWAPVYKTYGGDNELSCWVYRLGYKIVGAPDARVRHHYQQDRLRSQNTKTDRQRRAFWLRWRPECLSPRGPYPVIQPGELTVLKQIERGESPAMRWDRIEAVDPVVGTAPPRAPVGRERVLHWQLWTRDDPQTCMVGALRRYGSAGSHVEPWTSLGPRDRGRRFLEIMHALRPTVVFLQCQDPGAIPIEALHEARTDPGRDPALVVCVWSGDIGPTKGPWPSTGDGWQYRIAPEVDLMLFTGTGTVQIHRQRGMKNAAYLQIGYDTDRYYLGTDQGYGRRHSIVFMGQNYGPSFDGVPTTEAPLRRQAVGALRAIPGFVAYGAGFGAPIPQVHTGDVYRASSMALSISLVSSLGRYTSDRMLRSMACGCPTLVKKFADMEGMGLEDGENCIIWDTVPELLDKARHWLEPHRREQLREIGKSGAKLMMTRHTWDARMLELAALVRAVRGYR